VATVAAGRPAAPGVAVLGRLGAALWRLFSSVDFAAVQILVLAVMGALGMTLAQLPGFAFRSAGDYAAEMARIHDRYDPLFGEGVVDILERLGAFHVFTSTPFSLALLVLVVSIVICTLDRTPRLWRDSADIRVVQPPAYYDPRLPNRVRIAAGGRLTAAGVTAVLRRHRYGVRTAAGPDGASHLYADRNRWTKLATLVSHLGLILFLLAGAITARFGDEQGLVVAEGETLSVQPIGTPGLLLVRNEGFEAPGLFESGSASDFTTDLSVFADGRLVARKVIRVNDPLTVGEYTFHQNGFGPAPDLLIRDTAGGILWSGPVPLTDQAGGLPFGTLSVPGREVGLQLLLDRTAEGVGVVLIVPYIVTGTDADGRPVVVSGFPLALARGEEQAVPGLELSIAVRAFAEYTLLIAKKDPGVGLVWFAFACLISGLAVTFYLPRRRVWARLEADGALALVGRADRTVDHQREFGRLVDDLVAACTGPGAVRDGAGAEPAGPGPVARR
jgi:cytochrome c biogenesis protein